jgi:hypothetical protein
MYLSNVSVQVAVAYTGIFFRERGLRQEFIFRGEFNKFSSGQRERRYGGGSHLVKVSTQYANE